MMNIHVDDVLTLELLRNDHAIYLLLESEYQRA